MAGKRRDGDLVAWSALRVDALQVDSAATLKSLKAKIDALWAHSAIDEQTYQELKALIEGIDGDIDSAHALSGRSDTSG